MFAAPKNGIPVLPLRSYSSVWEACSRAEHDLKLHVIDEIFNQHAHRIKQWNHKILNPYQLEIYADGIHTKGAALNNCFGFVDGTVRAISRPIENQEITYEELCSRKKISAGAVN